MCLKQPLKIDKTMVLVKDVPNVMKVESVEECFPLNHSAIHLICIARKMVLKPILEFFLSVPLRQVLMYKKF